VRRYILTILITLFTISISQLGLAQESVNPCDGDGVRVLRTGRADQLQGFLNNYQNYQSNGSYRLCFAPVETPFEINQPLSFNIRADLPVIISGLNLKPSQGFSGPLISIGSNAAQVTLHNITISEAQQAIVLEGKYHQIISSNIRGNTQSDLGVGVDLRAYKSRIQNSNIEGFHDMGIYISADASLIGAESSDTYAAEKNSIHHNGIGIYVASGNLNSFAYNSLYSNKPNAELDYSPEFGISMSSKLLQVLERPELNFIELESVDPSTSAESEEKFALHCLYDEETGNVLERWLEIKDLQKGSLVVYEIFRNQNRHDSIQGYNHIGTCQIDQDGKCLFTFPERYQITEEKCGQGDLKALALLQTTIGTTVYTQEYFILDDGDVVAEVPDIEQFSPGGGIGAAGLLTEGGGEGVHIASADPGILPDDEESGNSQTTSSALTGNGSGGIGGITSANSVGAGGCSLSIAPSSPGRSFIFFLLFSGILILLRCEKQDKSK